MAGVDWSWSAGGLRSGGGLNRVDELDRLCVDTAITGGALAQGLTRNALLCINCEPSSTMVGLAQNAVLKRGHTELQLMFELTERSLLAHPRALLAKVDTLRGDGFGIALDDVGGPPPRFAGVAGRDCARRGEAGHGAGSVPAR